MDYASLLYGPIYATLGVPAVLTIDGTDGAVLELTMIDKTSGVVIGGGGSRFNTEVETVGPAAAVQAADLADIDLASLRDASLLINGKTWKVRNHQMKPSPNGEAAGEVLLLLTEKA